MRLVDAREALDQTVEIRLTMLREVERLPAGHVFPEDFVRRTAECFASDFQTTRIMVEQGRAVACATLCYYTTIPSLRHPAGHRAHMMNVYTLPEMRRQGIARQLLTSMIDEARSRGVTEILLDATDAGRPLYEALGFERNDEGMTLFLHP